MVKNAGIASSASDQFILTSGFIINEPTSTKAIEVAMGVNQHEFLYL